MFYLKYRPHTLAEIDNSRVTDILNAVLKSKELPHAFLFIGQKGTGKTSTARIIAKSINCLKQPKGSFEPCNGCVNCKSVDLFSSPDVIEMDAASNRGIEDVKRLIKESSFMPMMMKYRVFIIDEAHMITPDAFNALLKTLEEPPRDVVFILATTNPEKLPKTIISRCFIVNFGLAGKKDIVHMLKRIAESEKITVDEKVCALIAAHAENSFRDASKVFEELVIQNKLKLEEARDFLGIAKNDLLEILDKKSIKEALVFANEFASAGGSIKHLIENTLFELRLLLLKKNGIPCDYDKDLLFTKEKIVKLMKLMTEAYNLTKTAPIESIPLEIAIVEFYNLK